jgi:hypothetical protein
VGFIIFVFLGVGLEVASPISMMDFKIVFYGARCIVEQVDPYSADQPLRLYIQDHHQLLSDENFNSLFRTVMGKCIYPPSALVLLSPLALLPFGFAHILWMALTIASFGLAAFLAWDLGSTFAPRLSALLIAFLLANNVQVIFSGNPAGIVVSLCVIAAWCFVRRRFIWIGVLCLALAVGLKPQDAIWVWAFFVLAGAEYRKLAFRCFWVTGSLCLLSTLRVWQIAPNWVSEIRSNFSSLAIPGGLCDPNLAALGHYGVSEVITLQSAFSYFRNDPAFYNAASYLVCLPPLLFWAWITMRSTPSKAETWLGLAAILPLSMLPVYHRPYDAKLLVLMVPACGMLWKEGGKRARVATCLTLASLIATADLPWILLDTVGSRWHLSPDSLAQRALTFVWVIPIPFILLGTGAFYLWEYGRRAQRLNRGPETGEFVDSSNSLHTVGR